MCPKCRNFTNAPVGQKRRRCSYCGSIIDITKAAVVLVDSPEAASTAVKIYNASRGGDEFEKAVERSRERVKSLVPAERISSSGLTLEEDVPPTGKRARLLSILEERAATNPISLTELEKLCNASKLSWTWVEKQLTAMGNSGMLIFPKPWTVKLVRDIGKAEEPQAVIVDVSDDILGLLNQEKKPLRIDAIIGHFDKRSISSASVIASLEKLMSAGEIYEPRQGHVSIV